MATRSGKRIHRSFYEENIETPNEIYVKSEKKTISKPITENISDSTIKSKKRKNYVKYPSDEELPTEINEVDGNCRVLRKNTLKEQNINVFNSANIVESSKQDVRTTRRTKKILENETETLLELGNVQTENDQITKKPKGKKNKKKKKSTEVLNEEIRVAKPKKKKVKKSNSLIVEDMVSNGQNQSTDSIHSAAGSPIKEGNSLKGLPKPKKLCNGGILLALKDAGKPESVEKENIVVEVLDSSNNFKKSKKTSGNKTSIVQDVTHDKNEINSVFNDSTHTKCSRNSLKECSINMNTTYEKESRADSASNTHDNLTSGNNLSNSIKKNKRKQLDSTFDTEEINKEIKSDINYAKKRKSVINTTLDKNESIKNNSTFKSHETKSDEIKRSSLINTTYEKEDKSFEKELDEMVNKCENSINDNTFDKNIDKKKLKRESTFDKMEISAVNDNNVTFNSENNTTSRKSVIKDTTFEKSNSSLIDMNNVTFEKESDDTLHFNKSSSKRKSLRNNKDLIKNDKEEFANNIPADITYNTTFENASSNYTFDADLNDGPTTKSKSSLVKSSSIVNEVAMNNKGVNRNSIRNTIFDKDITKNNKFEIDKKERKSLLRSNSTEIVINENVSNKRKSFSCEVTLNETFEKSSKSSLISSDCSTITDNCMPEINNISDISITSDESDIIVNTTPLLVESSIDETLNVKTPLEREGTFTKDSPKEHKSPKLPSISPKVTPKKPTSLPSAGCTPYHVSGGKKKSLMNITRSIEKDRSSVDLEPRVTKVMFCSPVFDPVVASQQKRKIIKSNLKGSNKSFVYDDSAFSPRPAPRKRSYTHNDADDTHVKRSRLVDSQQTSVNRLSRPRTSSASGKLTLPTTPSKKTPQKTKQDLKVTRTKLPNFAALHQKQFAQMESLNECQQRKAKRAKQLLTPTGSIAVSERTSSKGPITEQKQKEQTKSEVKTLPTLESLRRGYTRFGFKMNVENNPFTAKTDKVESKVYKTPKNIQSEKKCYVPSLTGCTMRKDVAKQVVMREKSFTDRRTNKRNENRTIIKGVRTNRRFELQMKLRNIEG